MRPVLKSISTCFSYIKVPDSKILIVPFFLTNSALFFIHLTIPVSKIYLYLFEMPYLFLSVIPRVWRPVICRASLKILNKKGLKGKSNANYKAHLL